MTTETSLRSFLRASVVLTLLAGTVVVAPAPARAAHDPDISISDAEVFEGDSGTATLSFTVTLSAAPGALETTTVDWATSDFTAVAGQDYVADSGTLTFTALGSTTQDVDVDVTGDIVQEGDEVLFVGLSNASDGQITDGSAAGTILNDDGPAISVADAQGPESGGSLTFEVTLDAASSQDVEVDYTTTGDTATEGVDFADATGTLTIPAGATQGTITVTLTDDELDEDDETFDLVLSNPTADATLADDEAVGTILDDDDPVTVAIADVFVDEGNAFGGQTAMGFVVTLSSASDKAVSFGWSTRNGTAVAGPVGSGDYVGASGSRTIPAGSTQTTITVQARQDTTPEDHETFFVDLFDIVNAGTTDNVGAGTVYNDDATLAVADATPVQEGEDVAVFEVTIPYPTSHDVTAISDTADGSGDTGATAPQDYSAVVDGEVVIVAGETSTVVQVELNDDDRDEPDAQTFSLSLSAPSGATITDGTAVGTLLDDDALPNLAVADVSSDEDDAGEHAVTLAVTLVDGDGLAVISDRDVEVDWTTRDGSAVAGDDYTAGSGTVVIPGGTDTDATPGEIDVQVHGDTAAEGHEVFFVDLEDAPTNADIADGTGAVTIEDDDDTLTIEDATVVEGDSGTTNAEVTVRLGRTLSEGETVTVDYASADDTATTADGDYDAVSGTLTFIAGEQVQTILIPVNGDATSEDDETFTVTLSGPSGAVVSGGTATVTIVDDEDLRLLVDDAEVVEGDADTTSLDFLVTLVGGVAGSDIEFVVDTSDGTAEASAVLTTGDYEGISSGSGTVVMGETSTTVSVVVNGDTDREAFETMTLTISDPTGAEVTIGDGTAVGTIQNDDAGITVADVTVEEGGTSAFVVTLSHPVAFDVDVTHALDGDTAEAGDFVDDDGTTTIAAGDTTEPVVLATVEDTTDEDDETVVLALADVDTGDDVVLDDDGTATGTITDDDAAPTISISDGTVAEGDSGVTEVVLDVILSAATEKGDVTVAWATVDGTATGGSDYAAASGVATVPAGEMATTVTVAVAGDTVDEVDETFRVELSDPTRASIADGSGRVTITDDDEGTLSVADAAAGEADGTVELTITLSAPAPGEVTFDWDTADGSATAGDDYEAVSGGSGSVAAGETTTTIAVTLLDDDVHESTESFAVVLSDPSGATIDDGSAQVQVGDDDPGPMDPVAVAAAPASAVEGDGVAFDGSGSGDPDGSIVAWDWDFDDGATASGEQVEHAFGDDGTYVVTLTVTDDAGRTASDTATVTVDNADPVVEAGPDRDLETWDPVTFAAVVGDAGDDPLTVTWDFGDGDTATGRTVTHAFAIARTFTVRVTVTDGDGGSATDTLVVRTTDSGVVTRSSGEDRILTSVAVSRDHWPTRGAAAASTAPATDAVLARADLYADALASGPLTAALDAPLLLTRSTDLPEVVEAELARLGVDTVWLLGGDVAIAPAVEARLVALGYQVERLSGPNRFATAAAVASHVGPAATDEVVVALGGHEREASAWPDALSAGSLSASPDRPPVLLVEQDRVPDETLAALAELGARRIRLLGGAVAIHAPVEDALRGRGYLVDRLAGTTRYTTSMAVAADAVARHGDEPVALVLATGTNFPDGLAAGALAARLGGVVLLVPHDLDQAPEVEAFLVDHAQRFDRAVVIGGTTAVPEEVRLRAQEAIDAG